MCQKDTDAPAWRRERRQTDGRTDKGNTIYMPFPPFFDWRRHKKKQCNKYPMCFDYKGNVRSFSIREMLDWLQSPVTTFFLITLFNNPLKWNQKYHDYRGWSRNLNLTIRTPSKIFSGRHKIVFVIFPRKQDLIFHANWDNLHEMSSPVFCTH